RLANVRKRTRGKVLLDRARIASKMIVQVGRAGPPRCFARDAAARQLVREVRAVETTKQITVFLENKPGRLANVLSALAREKVNITALSVMDSHEHRVLRVVAGDLAKTRQVLKTLGTRHVDTVVVLIELRKQTGDLAHV